MHVVTYDDVMCGDVMCDVSSNFAFITITTKFLSKHCIKRVLDTEMNGYHCFNFTEKLSYEV
jgi:hypothetical protein